MALGNSGIYDMNTYLVSTYHIPNYQREYSWEEEQLEDFWNDLTYSTKDEVVDHFFGQIVIHKDEDNDNQKFIIDGQQRTITSMIFLSAIKAVFDAIYQNDKSIIEAHYRSVDIESRYIGRKDEEHLLLGELDREYFIENIQLGTPSKDDNKKVRPSQERIDKAYFYFKDCLSNDLDSIIDDRNKYDRAKLLYDTFIEKFKVLYMEATDLSEAFIIFETLNARGKELETSDLLKNFLLSHSSDATVALKKWNGMIEKLDGTDSTKYIRCFWNSCNTLTREKQLYKNISNLLKSRNSSASDDFLKELCNFAPYYCDLSNPMNCEKYTNKDLITRLKALKSMNAATFYPVILAMERSNRFKEDAVAEVLEIIELFVFRNFSICKKTANSAETFFAEIAKKIYDNDLKDATAICDMIKQEIVSDDEFKTSFIEWKSNNKELIRYILRKIHLYLDPANQEININNNEVHIEHIMPKDNSQWNMDDDIHQEYLWRLGNLALLSQKLNAKIKAKPFADKKEEYKKSIIKPNDELLSISVWDENEIVNRQKRLAECAIEIWKK